jgi:hypothetical protein
MVTKAMRHDAKVQECGCSAFAYAVMRRCLTHATLCVVIVLCGADRDIIWSGKAFAGTACSAATGRPEDVGAPCKVSALSCVLDAAVQLASIHICSRT